MPLKPVDFELELDSQPVPQENGFLKKAGQFATGLGAAALQSPFKLLELPYHAANYLSEKVGFPLGQEFKPKLPFLQNKEDERLPSEFIESKFNPEDITPENTFSKALQYTAGNWPLIAFTGGGALLPKIATDIAGSVGISAAEDLGFGVLGKLGAGILASKGFNKLASSFKGALTKPSNIQNFTSDLYNKEKQLGSTIRADPSRIGVQLENIYKDVENKFTNTGKFTETSKNRLLGNIVNANRLINKNNLTGSDLFEVKKLLNEAYAPAKSLENTIYKRMRSLVKGELDILGSKNKDWGDTWKAADELYKIEKWQSNFGRWLDEISQSGKLGKLASNPLTQTSLAILGGFFKSPQATALGVIPFAGKEAVKGAESIKRGYDFLNTLGKTKDGQKLLWEIAIDSAKNSSNSLIQNVSKLNKKADKFEEQEPLAQNSFKPVNYVLEFAD